MPWGESNEKIGAKQGIGGHLIPAWNDSSEYDESDEMNGNRSRG
jgi:hypothetical protein